MNKIKKIFLLLFILAVTTQAQQIPSWSVIAVDTVLAVGTFPSFIGEPGLMLFRAKDSTALISTGTKWVTLPHGSINGRVARRIIGPGIVNFQLQDTLFYKAGTNITLSKVGTDTLQIAATGGGGGDITGVSAGTGLSGGGLSGDVTLNADTASVYIQTKTENNTLYQAKGDTATYDASKTWVLNKGYLITETGDISAVTAGNGLTGGGTSGAVTLDVNPKLSGVGRLIITSDSLLIHANSIDSTLIIDGALATGDYRIRSITGAKIALATVDSINAVNLVSTDIKDGALLTADYAARSVTFAKLPSITDNRLLGRSAGSNGDMQEITIGSGLALSGGNLTSTVASGASTAEAFITFGNTSGLSSERAIAEGTYIDLNDNGANASIQISFDPTEFGTEFWWNGTSDFTWTFNRGGASQTRPTMTFADSKISLGTTQSLETTSQHALWIKPYGSSAGNTGQIEFWELVTNGTNSINVKAVDNIAVDRTVTFGDAGGTVAVSASSPLAVSSAGNISVNSSTGTLGSVVYSILPTMNGAFFNNEVQIGDGTTDTPNLAFIPQTGTEWDLYVTDSDDDFNIKSNTSATENVDIINLGAGTANLTVEGALTLGTALTINNGGTGLSSTPASGQLLIGNGSNYTLAGPTMTFGAGSDFTWTLNGGGASANDPNITFTSTASSARIDFGRVGTTEELRFMGPGAGGDTYDLGVLDGSYIRLVKNANDGANREFRLGNLGDAQFNLRVSGDVIWSGVSDGNIIKLEQSTNPINVTEGREQWDTDDNDLIIGDGATIKRFRSLDFKETTQEFNFTNTATVQEVMFAGIGNRLFALRVAYSAAVVFTGGSPAIINIGRANIGGGLNGSYFTQIAITSNKSAWQMDTFGLTNSDLNAGDTFVISFTGTAGFTSGKCVITTYWKAL